MTARFAIYEARDPLTRELGFAGFVENAQHLRCVGFRPTAALVRAEIESTMRHRQIARARNDEGEVIECS
jgi:hypothetical protein